MPIGLKRFCPSLAVAAVIVCGAHDAARAGASTPDASPSGSALPGPQLVRTYCSGCHRERGGEFERISSIRKTPEGWVMTIFRMRQVHGLVLDPKVRESIVRYLADTQGLAPAESAAGRFALQQRPNAQDIDDGPEIGVMCGRCHSVARVALQRRDEEEWRKLAHTHVGQWPSIEYSASGRDRPWWQIASGPLPAKLAALYPFSTTAWSDWKQHPRRDLSGNWVVVGRVPGGRDFYGAAHIERDGDANDGTSYKARYELRDVTGEELNGDSKAILYTGYEWRGSAALGGRERSEVYAVAEDGNRISGRWFDPDHPEDGGDWVAVREEGAPQVLAVLPQSLRAGTATTVIIVGTGLGAGTARVSFGAGTVAKDVRREPHDVRARVTVAPEAAAGVRVVATGGAEGRLTVYRQIDQITVVPAYAIARVGGGRVAPITAQFEAIAATRLPSGELLPLGPVAAEWSSLPYDAEAKRTEDEKFAGHFDRRGVFLPAGAGPNPAREYTGDNVGNLTVLAKAQDGARTIEGRGHLVVTVQRWNTPPIY